MFGVVVVVVIVVVAVVVVVVVVVVLAVVLDAQSIQFWWQLMLVDIVVVRGFCCANFSPLR